MMMERHEIIGLMAELKLGLRVPAMYACNPRTLMVFDLSQRSSCRQSIAQAGPNEPGRCNRLMAIRSSSAWRSPISASLRPAQVTS